MLAPDVETPAEAAGALPHPRQAPMEVAASTIQNLWINAVTVIANAQAELGGAVIDLHFDMIGVGVAEGVAQRLAGNPIDFIPDHWIEGLRAALSEDSKCRCRITIV